MHSVWMLQVIAYAWIGHEYWWSSAMLSIYLSCVFGEALSQRTEFDLLLEEVLLVEEQNHARVLEELVVANGAEQPDGIEHSVLLRVFNHLLFVVKETVKVYREGLQQDYTSAPSTGQCHRRLLLNLDTPQPCSHLVVQVCIQ